MGGELLVLASCGKPAACWVVAPPIVRRPLLALLHLISIHLHLGRTYLEFLP